MRTPLYICVAISFAYLSLYSIVNHWPMERSTFPLLDIEDSVPYLNWTYLIYLSAFVQAVYVIRLIPKKSLVRYMMAPSLALVVGVIFFLLYPVEYPRYLFPDNNYWVNIFRNLDMPGNCFPSLHVSMTILFAYIYSAVKTKDKYYTFKSGAMWLWSALVVLSVLTTKQHYLMDVFGGIALSIFVILIMERYVYN